MKYTFIVAAAGVGKRMGLGYPKQFLEWNKKPIFIHTLETINKNKFVTDIIVVTNGKYLKEVEEFCRNFEITKVKKVVEGGKERQDSIYNALRECGDSDLIGVQDGVRPFIEEKFIEEAYKEVVKGEVDGVVIGVPVKDTIKIVDENGFIISTPIRKNLISAQTPQVFCGKKIIEAYEVAQSNNYFGTDDSSLIEYIGGKVKILEGSYKNIKITTPEDIRSFQ